MNRKSRLIRKMMLLTVAVMGTSYAASCSLRDIRDSVLSGGEGFVKSTITSSLGILFPLTDLITQRAGGA